jgi:hypothetical protein
VTNTAPVPAPIVSREIAPGVVIDTSMTPEQRFAAIAKSMATGEFTLRHNGAGPPLEYQTHGTQTRIAQGEKQAASGKAAPPAPKPEAASKPSTDAVAAFDAEQRAAGKQLPLDRPDLAGGGIDQAALDALTVQYRALIAPLYGKPDAAVAATIERFKRAYENDVKSILDGRKLTAAQIAKLNGTPGNVDSFLPKAPSAPAPTAPVARNGWQSHIEDGQWVGLENITTADTHGYTIPRYVKEQRLHVSAFDQLRVAKAAGITQAQVNAVLHQEAISKGWVKA